MQGSTPAIHELNPTIIPFQRKLIYDINSGFDYSLGTHECLLSGSVGSAKSLIAAHIGILHCLRFQKSRLLIARRAMPDLRDTIFAKIVEHLEGSMAFDGMPMIEGQDYKVNHQRCEVRFNNGSEIISRSWADRKYKKLGSIEVSAAIVEELTENDEKDETAIKYLRMRVGRLPHVPQNFILYCTNPDSPSHFAYDYFSLGNEAKRNHMRHVYYSKTTDNPFLPDWYIEQLKENLDEKLAQRMIYGKWIEISKEVIYHAYSSDINFKDEEYLINPYLPIIIGFDFNIGAGKPMSACLCQYDERTDTFHFFDESIVEGADTLGQMEEMAQKGLLSHDQEYIICGDATGKARSSKSLRSDYDIITHFLNHYHKGQKIDYRLEVPQANPPIKERHNKVNAYCRNANGKSRLYVYRNCKVLDKGFRLAALKEGGSYIEDDSKPYQHVTTAAGYIITRMIKLANRKPALRKVAIR